MNKTTRSRVVGNVVKSGPTAKIDEEEMARHRGVNNSTATGLGDKLVWALPPHVKRETLGPKRHRRGLQRVWGRRPHQCRAPIRMLLLANTRSNIRMGRPLKWTSLRYRVNHTRETVSGGHGQKCPNNRTPTQH